MRTKRLTLSTRRARTHHALILSSLLAFPALTAAAAQSRRAQAQTAYDRAESLRAKLESQHKDVRTKGEYEKVIRAYRAVYQIDVTFAKAPVSLAAIAELYEEMGRVFSKDRYYDASIDAYQFLIQQYPGGGATRDALFRIGDIYQSDLGNIDEAQKAFQKFLEVFPRAPKAAEARERIKELNQILDARTSGPAGPKTSKGSSERATGAPQVTTIRRWVGPNYSRIVIDAEDEVRFNTMRLASPDRIVLDLTNTRLSPDLIGKAFPVEDGFLRQIRVAQFKPNVTRVVLDVEKIENYSVFSLPNPFRLVVDIHGSPPLAAERPASTPPGSERPTPEKETASAASKPGGAVSAGSTSAGRGPARNADQTAAIVPMRRTLGPPSEPSNISVDRGPEAPIKPATPTTSGSRTLTRALGLKVAKIVIDPGHGGHDTGTIGAGGLREKDLVLDVGLRLKRLIERNLESTVVMTRTDDSFIPLEERTAIANQNAADLFISIHANASRDQSARGIETYYLNFTSNPEALEVAARENATSQESVHQLQDLIKKIALTEKIEESHEVAKQVQRLVSSRLAKVGGQQRNRGVKKAPFVVLIGANMPSILTEISFLTSPQDERLLKHQDYRQKIAVALYQGLSQYMYNLGGVKVAQKSRISGLAEFPAVEPPQAARPNF
jgi:N-acetylmuramoyl-L-alanine amidase